MGYDDIELDDGFYAGFLDGRREYIFLDENKDGILVIASVKDADVKIRYSRVYEGFYERVTYTFVDGVLTDRNEFASYNQEFGKQM